MGDELINGDEFTRICKLSDLKENDGRKFMVNDVEIAVFRTGDKVYALSNICPHQHASLIYDGFIEDGCVICPVHGWEFSLQSGKMKTGSRGLETFPVEVKGEDVYVKVLKKELRW